MRKVVLCFAHKNPEQVNILIKQLLHKTNGNTDIFLHIDKNNEEIKNGIILNDHLFYIKNNVAITWGNDSMINALMASFLEIKAQYKKYDYFLICTGQDLVVKPGLDKFLEENNGNLYLDVMLEEPFRRQMLLHHFPTYMCRYLGKKNNPIRILRSMYVRLIRLGLIPCKKVRYDTSKITFYKSFDWCAIPYDTLLYLLEFLKKNPGFMDMYYKTYLPEDGFLGTILMNSPYKDRVILNEDGKGATITYLAAIKDQHIVTLTEKDRIRIDESKCFFARKFETSRDMNIVKYYENKILMDLE